MTLRKDELKAPNGKPYYRVEKKRTKTGVSISNVIPNWVAEELLAVPNEKAEYFFWSNAKGGMASSSTTNWQREFKRVFHAVGLPEGHPHQLRDLKAVSLLEKGIAMEDVSRALGHKSIVTTENTMQNGCQRDRRAWTMFSRERSEGRAGLLE